MLSVIFMVSSCYNSGAGTSSLKEITSFSLSSSNGTVNGKIAGQSIAVTMPYGTDVRSLVARFTITGKSVKVGSKVQVNGITANDYTNPVVHTVLAADGTTQDYTVTVTVPNTLFSCITDGLNSCGCLLENDGSGLIWYADGNNWGSWSDWCSSSGPAADVRCHSEGMQLVEFNKAGHCGFQDWHLPRTPNVSDQPLYVYEAGGEWGSLAIYAQGNGWNTSNPFSLWLNIISKPNHFYNVLSPYYWSSKSGWTVDMYNGGGVTGGNLGPNTGVMLVHGYLKP